MLARLLLRHQPRESVPNGSARRKNAAGGQVFPAERSTLSIRITLRFVKSAVLVAPVYPNGGRASCLP